MDHSIFSKMLLDKIKLATLSFSSLQFSRYLMSLSQILKLTIDASLFIPWCVLG